MVSSPPGEEKLGIKLRKGSQEDAATSNLRYNLLFGHQPLFALESQRFLWRLEACLLAHSFPLVLPLKMASGYDRALSGNPD
jgi:hypothetical protein